jgi:hypothetical protein
MTENYQQYNEYRTFEVPLTYGQIDRFAQTLDHYLAFGLIENGPYAEGDWIPYNGATAFVDGDYRYQAIGMDYDKEGRRQPFLQYEIISGPAARYHTAGKYPGMPCGDFLLRIHHPSIGTLRKLDQATIDEIVNVVRQDPIPIALTVTMPVELRI